jgi:hypothetical protein
VLEEQTNENVSGEEEQARALIAAYHQEFRKFDYSFPQDHPLYEQLKSTISTSFKWHLISEVIQGRSFTKRDLNLIKVLSLDPLSRDKESHRAFLRICVVFCSSEDLSNTHYHSLAPGEQAFLANGAAIIATVLRNVESSLKQPDIHAYVQEELSTLYALSHDAEHTEYFVNPWLDQVCALRLLIADLLFLGNAPGLASLLHDDETTENSSFTEERARAVLAAYHQEMGSSRNEFPDHPVPALVKQRASQHLKVLLIKEALQEAYTSAQNQENLHDALPLFYYQNVALIRAIFTYDLPYSNEDILSILLSIAHIFKLPRYCYQIFNLHGSSLINLFDVFSTFLSRLEQSEVQILQRNVLIVFYEPFKYLRWNSPDQDVNRLRQRLRGMLFPESAGPLRDLLRDNSKHFTSESELRALLAAYHEEFGGGTPYASAAEAAQLLKQRLSLQSIARLLSLSAEEIPSVQPSIEPVPPTWRSSANSVQVEQNIRLIQTLCHKELPFTPDDIRILLRCFQFIYYPASEAIPLARELKPLLQQPGVLAHCRTEIEALLHLTIDTLDKPDMCHYPLVDIRHFYLMLRDVLSGHWQHFSYPLLPDRWGASILDELAALSPTERDPWLTILNICAQTKGKTPPGNWLAQAQPLIEAVGTEYFTPTLRRWISFFSDNKDGYMDEKNSDILRALIWLCKGNSDRGLAATLGDAAIEGYRKLPGAGPRCPKVGDAVVFTLVTMPGKDAISQLERVRRNVKQPSFQAKIGSALDSVAQRENMSRTDLEELMLPTFDLQDGQVQIALGEWTVQLSAGGRNVEQRWLDANGQPHTTLPVAVKRAHKEEIKTIKRLADDMENMISSLRNRLEHMFLHERCWSLDDWRDRYLDHPLVSVLARRLIWQINVGEQSWRGIWQQGQLVNAQSQPLELPIQSEVILWHPLMSSSQEARSWQRWLEEQQVTQPFKQAHREVYPLTEAEQATRYYSRRFAGHILRQHQLNALARARDWRFSLHSNYSGSIRDDPASMEIPSLGIRAELTFSNSEEWDEEIPRYILTDQVRFPLPHAQPLPLDEIPAIVFSEVMRDVDLFVSVTSAGTDLQGNDTTGPIEVYWQAYNHCALTPQAAERRQILARLIPRLTIAERCTLEDRFLIVRGNLHTYRIHLISGNIFMEPGNKYLCIVFDTKLRVKQEERFFLPFDGDPLFSLILSKAFLLAEDSKITDPSILRQLQKG